MSGHPGHKIVRDIDQQGGYMGLCTEISMLVLKTLQKLNPGDLK